MIHVDFLLLPDFRKKSVITALLFKGLQDCPVCPSVKSGFEDKAESGALVELY
jgi:hypothetical protein